MPKVMQKHPKTFPWVPLGVFFEILSDLGNILFLMFFRSARRRAKIEKKSTFESALATKGGGTGPWGKGLRNMPRGPGRVYILD